MEIAQGADECSDLTQRILTMLQECCPEEVDAAQLDEMTWLIAEGRRLAEDVRLRAHAPSQIPRATIVHIYGIMLECTNWGKEAQEHIQQSLWLLAEQLRHSPADEEAHSPPATAVAPPSPPPSNPLG